jgi:hypothetical protein
MTKRNGKRQHGLFEYGVVAAFFLLSQNEPVKHCSAGQTPALSGRTPEFVVGGITHGQLAPDLRDVGG